MIKILSTRTSTEDQRCIHALVWGFVLLIILTFVIHGCKYKDNVDSISSKHQLDVTFDSTQYQGVVIENCSFNIPQTWKIHKQNRVFFFSEFNNDMVDHYFAVIKTDIGKSSISEKSYILKEYKNLLKDTSEVFVGYTLRKLTFENHEHCYLGEFFSKKSGEDYFAYFFIFSKNDNLYHLVLKLRKSESPSFKNIFRDIILSLKLDDVNVFSGKAEIESNEIVDISKDVF